VRPSGITGSREFALGARLRRRRGAPAPPAPVAGATGQSDT
jgi:hypothetical protein